MKKSSQERGANLFNPCRVLARRATMYHVHRRAKHGLAAAWAWLSELR